MLKKWGIALVVGLIVVVLYVAQFNKIDHKSSFEVASLDNLEVDEAAEAWESFYRVRAKLIDGNSADFSIPKELLEKEGKTIELTGAPDFYGSGCKREGRLVTITDFYLLPSVGLVEACEILPDVEMRWKIRVMLKEKITVDFEDMIGMKAAVKGRFKIDTSKPYEAVFYLEDAEISIKV